jgi:hypothetical protein
MNKYFLLFLSILILTSLSGQTDEQKLIPADLDPGDFFGRYLAIEGNDIMIGAHQDDQNGYASGSLYIFGREEQDDQFSEINKILPEDGNIEEFFGYSIDISGTWAMVGSHHDSDFGGSSGSAFLLKKNEGLWSIHQKILPDDPRAGDEFGKAVGLSGDQIAVGCFLDDDLATNAGSVYIFSLNEGNPVFIQEFSPIDAKAYDQFGNYLSIKNDRMIVGVPEKKDKGEKSGCAYVFKQGQDGIWEQESKLLPDDLSPGDEFGQSVFIGNSLLAVGAYKQDVNGENSGAVYIYNYNSSEWNLVQKIIPPDNQEGDHFGNAVYMDENLLAIGAYFDDDNGSKSGSVYLYKWLNGQFEFKSKLISSDGSFGDAFGSSVAIDSNFLLVGAYADSDKGFFSGSAYVYNISELLNIPVSPELKSIVYPNVFTNNLNVKIENHLLPAKISVFNQNGTKMEKWQQTMPLQNIELSHLPSGWYILLIQTKTGFETFRISKTYP